MTTVFSARLLTVLMVAVAAPPGALASDPFAPPSCTTEVSASKGGRTVGPFPVVGKARFPMGGVTDCDGWEVEVGSDGRGGASVHVTTAAGVEENADGTGCELVVFEHRTVVKPIDLEHDPRFHRRPVE